MDRDRESGFMLIEVTIASVLLVVGALGFMGAIFASQMMAQQTKEQNRANAALVTAVEEFRRESADNFDDTLNQYAGETIYERTEEIGADGLPVLVDREIRKTTAAVAIDGDPAPLDGTTSVSLGSPASDALFDDLYTQFKAGTITKDQARAQWTAAGNTSTLGSSGSGSMTVKSKTTDAAGTTTTRIVGMDSAGQRTIVKSSVSSSGKTTTEDRKVTTGVNAAGTTETTVETTKTVDPAQVAPGIVDMGMVASINKGAQFKTTLMVDETKLDPPMDLNGDGDALDTNVDPTQMTAGVMRVAISWPGRNGMRTFETTTIIARGAIGATYR
jgi:hypothetical protein